MLYGELGILTIFFFYGDVGAIGSMPRLSGLGR